jgi:arginine/lysine/ornithine decarboxylase
VFSGALPHYVEPEIDPEWQIPLGMTPQAVVRATSERPDATAVFTSSPNYYGVGADLAGMAEAAHAAGLPFVVDQAWGPHLRFCGALPADAMAAGADAAVNSTHKLIAGLTQASLLVARGERVNLKRLAGIIKMTQSTSRLALIFASIDASRQQMAMHGEELWQGAIELSRWARQRIREIPGMRILGEEILEQEAAYEFDPTRFTFTARDVGLSGYELETILRDDYRIAVEMAEPINVMCNITHGDSMDSVRALVDALADVAARYRGTQPGALLERAAALQFPRFTRQVLSPRTAFYAASDVVSTRDAVGRIGTEILTPYPPGIPALGPGEEVSKEIVEYLLAAAEVGVRVQGAEDASLQTLRVVAE